MGETLSQYIEKFDVTPINLLRQEIPVSCFGASATRMKSILDPNKDKLAIQFVLWKFALENMVERRVGGGSILLTQKNCLMKRDKPVMMVA